MIKRLGIIRSMHWRRMVTLLATLCFVTTMLPMISSVADETGAFAAGYTGNVGVTPDGEEKSGAVKEPVWGEESVAEEGSVSVEELLTLLPPRTKAYRGRLRSSDIPSRAAESPKRAGSRTPAARWSIRRSGQAMGKPANAPASSRIEASPCLQQGVLDDCLTPFSRTPGIDILRAAWYDPREYTGRSHAGA